MIKTFIVDNANQIEEIGEIMFRGAIIISIPLLLLFLYANIVYGIEFSGGPAQEIYTELFETKTYIAQKNELIIIHPQKYPNLTFLMLVKDFEFLVKRGDSFVKGGNLSNHDAVLTTLQFTKHTIWDINDTQGTNISIFDNGIYDLQFKSLYVFEDVLAFNLTEIDTTNNPYTTSVEPLPVQKIMRIFFWGLVFVVLIFIIYEIYQRGKYGTKSD